MLHSGGVTATAELDRLLIAYAGRAEHTRPVLLRLTTRIRAVARAKGVFLYDDDGRDYLDGSGGAMTVSIGHAVPEVLDAMRTLPRRQRECLVLRYYLDLSETEIASTLGISNGSVKSHASRGLAALARRLEARS